MQTAFNDELFRAPLIQSRTLTMLRFCRKIIFQEFGVKLVFTQEDLLEQINAHAQKSRNPNLRQLAELLRKELV